MSPFLPALDVAAGAPDDLDHRLNRVRALQRALQPAVDAQARERERLLEALPERRGGAGMAAVELAGQRPQAVERERVVLAGPRPAQPQLDGGLVALGQVIEDVALSLKPCGMSSLTGLGAGLLGSSFGSCSVLFRRFAAHTVSVGAVSAA